MPTKASRRSWRNVHRFGNTRRDCAAKRGTTDETSMKAAVFYGSEKGLRIEDVPVPKITPDQILVKVAAWGVCPTDLHYLEHGVPTFKKPPIILGHEASGIVDEAGTHVTQFKKGQRVLI